MLSSAQESSRAAPRHPYATAVRNRGAGSVSHLGLFGTGNLGNDGSLEAMIASLRRSSPETRITCICPRPDLISERFDIDAIPIRVGGYPMGAWRRLNRLMLRVPGKLFDFQRTVSRLRDFDLMNVPGTGILDDFGERPRGMPFEIFKWCLAAKLVGTPVAFASVGAGPIRHPLNRWLMVSAARLATYRSYRDQVSRDFMAGAGVDTRADPVCPDLVFGLDTPRDVASPQEERPLTVGIGVMLYEGWYRWKAEGESIYAAYLSKLSAFILWLLERGHDVRLLIGQDSDRRAIADVLDRLERTRPNFPRRRVLSGDAASLGELMAEIGETDVIVATRFHNIVCALKMARPAISLGYARKNEVLLQEAGLGAYCQHVEEFDVEKLKSQFLRLVGEREIRAAAIRARVGSYEETLKRQNAALLSLLARSRRRRLVSG
jgi:polysaccharide pyruvyl transferase WcaK-like protein